MIASLRDRILLLVIGLYLVLNNGFMQVRIPPIEGGGIPVGEIVLIISLATISYLAVFRDLRDVLLTAPFIVWWIFGISRVGIQVPEYGFWALRDATSLIESLFLIVGFAFAAREKTFEGFFQWWPRVIAFGCIYSLLFPWREMLADLSPKITAGAGYATNLLFQFQGISNLLIMAFCYILLFGRRTWLKYILATFFLAFAVLMWQARTIYLQLIGVSAVFFVFRRDALRRTLVTMMVILAFLFVLQNTDWTIEGRLGQPLSPEFVFNHVLAIFGIERAGVEGAAAGVPLRLTWWSDLYNQWTANPETLVFGLGYGIPLTSFHSDKGVIVREPHNSYVSLIARLGLVGAISFFWMHVLLVRAWWKGYKQCGNLEWQKGQNLFLLFLIFFSLIWIEALGEDAFEKPFYAIPYYFFWGVVIRFSWFMMRLHSSDSVAERKVANKGENAREVIRC